MIEAIKNFLINNLNNFKLWFDDLKEHIKYGNDRLYKFDLESDEIISLFFSNREIDDITYDGSSLRFFSGNLCLKLWAAGDSKIKYESLASNIELSSDWKSIKTRLSDSDTDITPDYNSDGILGYSKLIFRSKDISISYKNLNIIRPYFDKLVEKKLNSYNLKKKNQLSSAINAINSKE